jgi:hypothetical protein
MSGNEWFSLIGRGLAMIAEPRSIADCGIMRHPIANGFVGYVRNAGVPLVASGFAPIQSRACALAPSDM